MALSATTQLVSLLVTFPLCLSWGSWKESFLSLLGFLASFAMKLSPDGGLPWQFASNHSLSGHCLPSLTSVAQGTLYFVPWWTLLYVPWWTLSYCGSLPWRSLLCLWGMIWMSGYHHFSLSTGCWAVCSWGRISSVHLLLSVGPPLLFLKKNLRHLLVLCHFLFSLPCPNHQRSWFCTTGEKPV